MNCSDIPYPPYLPPRDVHAVCLWDDKGPAKIHQALKEDILDFIKQAQAVSSVSKRVGLLFKGFCFVYLFVFGIHKTLSGTLLP